MEITLNKEPVVKIQIDLTPEEFTQFDRALFLLLLSSMGEKKNELSEAMIADINKFKALLLAKAL